MANGNVERERVIVGIDLGATFSCISRRDIMGNVEIISNAKGESTTPSVVYFPDDGSPPIVGRSAKKQLANFPDRTIDCVTRQMKTPEEDWWFETPDRRTQY